MGTVSVVSRGTVTTVSSSGARTTRSLYGSGGDKGPQKVGKEGTAGSFPSEPGKAKEYVERLKERSEEVSKDIAARGKEQVVAESKARLEARGVDTTAKKQYLTARQLAEARARQQQEIRETGKYTPLEYNPKTGQYATTTRELTPQQQKAQKRAVAERELKKEIAAGQASGDIILSQQGFVQQIDVKAKDTGGLPAGRRFYTREQAIQEIMGGKQLAGPEQSLMRRELLTSSLLADLESEGYGERVYYGEQGQKLSIEDVMGGATVSKMEFQYSETGKRQMEMTGQGIRDVINRSLPGTWMVTGSREKMVFAGKPREVIVETRPAELAGPPKASSNIPKLVDFTGGVAATPTEGILNRRVVEGARFQPIENIMPGFAASAPIGVAGAGVVYGKPQVIERTPMAAEDWLTRMDRAIEEGPLGWTTKAFTEGKKLAASMETMPVGMLTEAQFKFGKSILQQPTVERTAELILTLPEQTAKGVVRIAPLPGIAFKSLTGMKISPYEREYAGMAVGTAAIFGGAVAMGGAAFVGGMQTRPLETAAGAGQFIAYEAVPLYLSGKIISLPFAKAGEAYAAAKTPRSVIFAQKNVGGEFETVFQSSPLPLSSMKISPRAAELGATRGYFRGLAKEAGKGTSVFTGMGYTEGSRGFSLSSARAFVGGGRKVVMPGFGEMEVRSFGVSSSTLAFDEVASASVLKGGIIDISKGVSRSRGKTIGRVMRIGPEDFEKEFNAAFGESRILFKPGERIGGSYVAAGKMVVTTPGAKPRTIDIFGVIGNVPKEAKTESFLLRRGSIAKGPGKARGGKTGADLGEAFAQEARAGPGVVQKTAIKGASEMRWPTPQLGGIGREVQVIQETEVFVKGLGRVAGATSVITGAGTLAGQKIAGRATQRTRSMNLEKMGQEMAAITRSGSRAAQAPKMQTFTMQRPQMKLGTASLGMQVSKMNQLTRVRSGQAQFMRTGMAQLMRTNTQQPQQFVQKGRFGFGPPPPPPVIVEGGFPVIPFEMGFPPRNKRGPPGGKKMPSRYAPSLNAVLFGITTTKAPKRISGAEFARGILVKKKRKR